MAKLRDPINSITHIVGAGLSVVGLIFLVIFSVMYGTVINIIGCTIFGVSLILLYTFSALYHGVNVNEKVTNILRKFDHIMIFILIAGTYTPIALGPLIGPWGWSIFGITWGIAIIGTIINAITLKAPRWLSTSLYVLMGWICLVAIVPMIQTFSIPALLLLLLGGISYTVGAVIYGKKKPNFKKLGFHEIFHIFVILGSICHYIFVIVYCI